LVTFVSNPTGPRRASVVTACHAGRDASPRTSRSAAPLLNLAPAQTRRP
jgi:hypothetical protein